MLIESAKTMPVFSRFNLPWNSICRQLKYFQSKPVKQHVPVPELALEGEVVDRQQRGDPLIARHAVILDLQIGRDQARLPVVDVQHVDRQVQQPDRLEHGAAEEDEPLAVVDVVLAVDAVELIAVEILVLLDEVDRHGAAGQVAAGEVAGDHLAADGHDEVDSQRFDGQAAIADLAIGRQDDGRLVSQPGQLDGQAPETSANPPVLAKGTASLVAKRIFTS